MHEEVEKLNKALAEKVVNMHCCSVELFALKDQLLEIAYAEREKLIENRVGKKVRIRTANERRK